jgi:hypothetical protein
MGVAVLEEEGGAGGEGRGATGVVGSQTRRRSKGWWQTWQPRTTQPWQPADVPVPPRRQQILPTQAARAAVSRYR